MVKRIIVPFVILASACLTKSTAEKDDTPTVKKLLRGFPAAIWCNSTDNDWPIEKWRHNETIQCEIRKDGSVLFYDSSIRWKDGSTKGYFFNASSKWNNANVTVSLTVQNSSKIQMMIFSVKEPAPRTAPNSIPTKWTFGKPLKIACKAPKEIKDSRTKKLRHYMSEDQFNSIKTVWKKDGEVISLDDTKFVFVSPSYGKERFAALEISSATFATTPGSYECSLEYGEHKLVVYQESFCIKDRENENRPHIGHQQDTYVVAPGSDVTVSCHGRGRGNDLGHVIWRKNGTSRRLCVAFSKFSHPMGICSIDFSITSFCHPASPEEIFQARLVNKGNFTSFYTLRNVTHENSGTYECVFKSSQKQVSTQFIIDVRELKNATQSRLTVALAIVGGVFITFLLLYAIYHWKRLEILYFRKKLKKCIETNRPATFLVYSDDVFRKDLHKNALNDVTQWMKGQGYEFHNPSEGSSYLDAGEHEAEHSLRVLEQCLSMTVILTPNLLKENTLEVFKIYAGFEDNVKRNFPIIFICTKEMEKRIFTRDKSVNGDLNYEEMEKGDNQDVLRTLRRFMKRNKDTVIHWIPGGSPEFYRHLYVALPKARARNQTTAKYGKGKEACGKEPI